MKASELRIGNSIMQYDEVVFVTWWRLELMEINEIVYNPIPLTEEWLLKFGFISRYSNYIIKAGDYFHSVKKGCGEWIYSYDKSDSGCYELKEIKYVHQLQNLYFALIGKELIIK